MRTKFLTTLATMLLCTSIHASDVIDNFVTKSAQITLKDNLYISGLIRKNKIECIEQYNKVIDDVVKTRILERESCDIIVFKYNGKYCLDIKPH